MAEKHPHRSVSIPENRDALRTFNPLPFLLILTCLAVVSLLFMTDLSRHFEFPKYFAFRWFIFLALLAFWASGCFPGALTNPFGPPLALLLASLGISLFAAPNMAEGLDVMSFPDVLGFYLMIGLSVHFLNSRRRLWQGFSLLIASAAAVAVPGLFQYFGLDPFGMVKNFVPISTIGNQNFASYIHEIALPPAFGLAVYMAGSITRRNKTIPWKHQRARLVALILLIIYLLIGAAHMLACNSTGNRLSMAVTVYILAWAIVILRYTNNPVRRKVMAIAALILLALLSYAFTRTHYYEVIWNKRSNIYRREVWGSTLQTIRDNVFSGIGPGNTKVIHALYETERERKALGPDVLSREAHNDYLDKILEGGFPAAIAVFWMVFITICLILGNLNNATRLTMASASGRAPPSDSPNSSDNESFAFWITLGLSGSIVSIGIHALVETPLVQPASAVLFAFVLSLLVALHRHLVQLPGIVITGKGHAHSDHAHKIVLGIMALTPRMRWGLAAILGLLLLALPFRTFLAEVHLRRATEAHDAFIASSRAGNRAQAGYYKEKMAQALDRAGELQPTSLRGWETLGRFYLEAGELTKAKAGLLQTLALDPNSKLAHNNLGVCYDKMGKPEDAKLQYQVSLAIDPGQSDPFLNLGLIFMQENQTARALACLTRAIHAAPTKPEAYKYRAVVRQSLANASLDPICQKRLEQEIRRDLSSYFQWNGEDLAPEDVTLLRDLAVLYDEAGDAEGAIRHFKKLHEIGRAQLESEQRLVELLFQSRRFQEAEKILRDLIRKRPDDALIRYNLAKIIARQGETRYADMLAVLREAIKRQGTLAEKARSDGAFRPYLAREDFQQVLRTP